VGTLHYLLVSISTGEEIIGLRRTITWFIFFPYAVSILENSFMLALRKISVWQWLAGFVTNLPLINVWRYRNLLLSIVDKTNLTK